MDSPTSRSQSPLELVNHFDCLPNEILAHIFSFYALNPLAKYAFYYGTHYQSPLLALSAICGRFMEVVQSTPILWSNVYLKQPKDTVDDYQWALLCLERSGTCPLDIEVNWGEFFRCPGESQMRDLAKEERVKLLMTILLPHASRWRTAKFVFDHPIYGVLVLKPIFNSLSLPILEDLTVHADDVDVMETRTGSALWGEGYHTPATFDAPRLTKVDLSGLGYDWGCFPFRGLTNLSLSLVPQREAFTIHQLRTILQASPLLHTLKFNGVELRVDEDATQVELAPIALKHLTTLELGDFESSADFTAVISSISTPCLTALCLLHPTGSESSTSALMDITSERYFTLKHVTRLSLCALKLPPHQALMLYNNMFRVMHNLEYISIDSCCPSHSDSSVLFNALSLTQRSPYCDTMCEPGGTVLPLPMLRELEAQYDPNSLSSLKKCLRLRWDYGPPIRRIVVNEGGEIALRPRFLENLVEHIYFAGDWEDDYMAMTIYGSNARDEDMDIDYYVPFEDEEVDEVEAYLLDFDPAVDDAPIVIGKEAASHWN